MKKIPFHFVRRHGLNTGGGSGPPTWGEVVGTLSDQSDLVAALAGKVNVGDDPYPQVVDHASLPSAAANTGEIYIVQTTTGIIGVRKLAGLWRSDGAAWNYLGLYGRNASEIVNVPGAGSSATDVQAAIDDIGGRSTDGWAEGATNLYFTAARVRSTLLTGISLASAAVVSATDTVLAAIGQLQAQITALTSTVGTKLNSSAVSAFGLTLIDDADNTAARATLGLGTLATQSGTFSGTSSGTNTGDQTSIVGISGTKAQFNNAATDGDFLFVGDIAQYTDENARDAIGAALVAGANVTITVDDVADTITVSAAGGGGGGSGDVVGPASATDEAIPRFDGTTGELLQDSGVKITDNGSLVLPENSNPTASGAGEMKLFCREIANRLLPAFIGPSGLDSALQPLLARNKIGYWCPPGNATTVPGVLGFTAPTFTGFTATARNVDTTNKFTRMRRLGYVTAATAGTVGQWRVGVYQYTVGSSSTNEGGFTYIIRFGISDAAAVSGARMFMGMRSSATPSNVEPSTLTNCIGIGHGASDTTMKLFYGGSAAQTPIDLGADFPADTRNTDVYELALFSAPNSGDIHYEVTRINTGHVATGTITNSGAAVLPTNTTLIAPWGYRTNNATALAVGLDVMSAYIDTDT